MSASALKVDGDAKDVCDLDGIKQMVMDQTTYFNSFEANADVARKEIAKRAKSSTAKVNDARTYRIPSTV